MHMPLFTNLYLNCLCLKTIVFNFCGVVGPPQPPEPLTHRCSFLTCVTVLAADTFFPSTVIGCSSSMVIIILSLATASILLPVLMCVKTFPRALNQPKIKIDRI